jgi:hypothetical protein
LVEPRPRKVSGAFRGVPRAYFEEAAEVANRVLTSRRGPEKWYWLGGLRCRVRYGSEGVAAVFHRTLAHLETAAETGPDLDVGVWDEGEAEELLPEPHPHMLVEYKNHCLELCSNARYLALDERWLGTRSYVDRQAGLAFYCVRDITALPYYETAAPLRSVVNTLLSARGRHLVHAAAVGTRSKGVLFTGPPGAGKSSTALSCLGGELGYLADDWCGVRDGDSPGLFSVYASAKLRPENVDRFAELRSQIHNYDRLDHEKATLFLAENWMRSLVLESPAKAILVPNVSGRATSVIAPMPQKEAWRAMIGWTLPQLPGCGRDSTALLTRFCARLPAFRLELGYDRTELRATLERFVAEL